MLIKSPRQYLIDKINADASLALQVDDVIFGVPQALDTPTANGSNTRVRITMAQKAPARGAMWITYHRVPFTKVFTDIDGVNPMQVFAGTTAKSAYDVISNIRQFTGMDLAQEDLVDTGIDWTNKRLLIQAASTSLGWLGQITAKVGPGDTVIGDAFTNRDLQDSFLYPYANTKLGQALIYSYRFDFSDFGSTLLGVTADNLDVTQLATMLKAVTLDDWTVYRNPTDYNLRDAEFVYNGLNTNPAYPGNKNYSRILVLNMSFYSLKLGGYLYLHYNA
jgi:hypothetical protein